VHPPPTNATTSHQTETILAPVSHGLANCQAFLRRPGCGSDSDAYRPLADACLLF
jgi:hypothetical protein